MIVYIVIERQPNQRGAASRSNAPYYIDWVFSSREAAESYIEAAHHQHNVPRKLQVWQILEKEMYDDFPIP